MKVKICMICKKYVSIQNFKDHFKSCRQNQLKTNLPKLPNNNLFDRTITIKKDCGCNKKT